MKPNVGQRVIKRLAWVKPISWVLARMLPPIDRWVYRRNRGRLCALFIGADYLDHIPSASGLGCCDWYPGTERRFPTACLFDMTFSPFPVWILLWMFVYPFLLSFLCLCILLHRPQKRVKIKSDAILLFMHSVCGNILTIVRNREQQGKSYCGNCLKQIPLSYPKLLTKKKHLVTTTVCNWPLCRPQLSGFEQVSARTAAWI